MRKWTLLLMVVVMGLVAGGCTTVQKGAAVGAAGGALVGGVWANNAGSLNQYQGALVGAAAGGLLGALIGDQLEDHSYKQLASEIDNLKNQLNAKDQLLAQRDHDLDALKTALDDLDKRLAEKERELADAQAALANRDKDLSALQDQLKQLQDKLGKEVEVSKGPYGINLSILNELLFASGQSKLSDQGIEILSRVSEQIRENFPNRKIGIEGHTDNIPITHSGWESNWELGAARALAVLHNLSDPGNISPTLMSATSYGEYQPVSDNTDEAARKLNRRAVIVIYPEDLKIVKRSAAEGESIKTEVTPPAATPITGS